MCAQETICFGSQEVKSSQLADWGREASKEKVIMPVCYRESVSVITITTINIIITSISIETFIFPTSRKLAFFLGSWF